MMNDTTKTADAQGKTAWTTPVLERSGTIHDVKGGGFPGLDANQQPAATS